MGPRNRANPLPAPASRGFGIPARDCQESFSSLIRLPETRRSMASADLLLTTFQFPLAPPYSLCKETLFANEQPRWAPSLAGFFTWACGPSPLQSATISLFSARFRSLFSALADVQSSKSTRSPLHESTGYGESATGSFFEHWSGGWKSRLEDHAAGPHRCLPTWPNRVPARIIPAAQAAVCVAAEFKED